MGEENYVCRLDEATLRKAEEELNEDPKNRSGAVETFRKWIYDQKYITCPTDTLFLLSFLRTKKFSQLEARRLLENYLTRRDKFAKWFKAIDPTDPKIHAVLDDGVFLILGKDNEGRQILMVRPGRMDVSGKRDKADIIRTAACFFELVYMTAEESQVHGTVTVADMSNMTMKHQTKFSMEERKNFLQSWQKNYPARIKGMHMYNPGAFFEFFMLVIRSAMSEKVQKRLHLHGQNLEGLYKHVPMSSLPVEYLPDDYDGPNAGTTEEIVGRMKARLKSPEIAERIRHVTDPKFGINLKLKPDYVPTESFRQLAVD